TTQARNKRHNRKSEFLYHDAEFLASVASWLGQPYPRETLNRGWELILLNQFHDILPGSSIGAVYEDCARDYAHIKKLGEEVRGRSLEALVAAVDWPGPARGLLVYNSLSWARDDVVRAYLGEGPSPRVVGPDGAQVPTQPLGDGWYLLGLQQVPACGYATYALQDGDGMQDAGSAGACLGVSERVLENAFFRLELNERGEITSLFDRVRGREVLPPGAVANEFQAFDDRCRSGGEAWDIEIDYEEKRYPLPEPATIRVIESGPVRGGVEVRRRLLSSELVQRIYIYERLPRIDFDTEIDWREKQVLLKVAFPLAVHTDLATYEIQFGNLTRPTHRNTSWDAARFEVPAHKWADLSEGDYGVSLLNDCKYGYDAHDNVLRLTVLRAPTQPDPHADEGVHHLTYSLFPHAGDWRQGTVQQAYSLNVPLGAALVEPHPGMLPPQWSLVSTDRPNAIVETVKVAEDSDELIVRVYEGYNQRGTVTLRFGAPIVSAAACNLIEDGAEPLPFEGDRVSLYLGPYQVRTLKVRLAAPGS
ncbi:MAG: alpha-mannosidase, partial [Anaerolineae bacterium]|nr:alpha-mannosidase [Anaerolineae bacterium]